MNVLKAAVRTVIPCLALVSGIHTAGHAQTVQWSAEISGSPIESQSLSGQSGRYDINTDAFGYHAQWQGAIPYPGRENPGAPFLVIRLQASIEGAIEPPRTGGAAALRAYMAQLQAGRGGAQSAELIITAPDAAQGATGSFDETVITLVLDGRQYNSVADTAVGQVVPGYQTMGELRTATLTVDTHTSERLSGHFEARLVSAYPQGERVQRTRGIMHYPDDEIAISGRFDMQNADDGWQPAGTDDTSQPARSPRDSSGAGGAASDWTDMVRDRDERRASAASSGAVEGHQPGAGVLVLDGVMIELEFFGCQGDFTNGGQGNAAARGQSADGDRVGVNLQGLGERGSRRAESVSINIGGDSYLAERRFNGAPPRGEAYMFYFDSGMFMAQGAADQIRGSASPEFMIEGRCPG